MTGTAQSLRNAIYLTGPTASGKTAIGVALAELLDAEIVAMDSMTLYRGLDIGTAKPTVAERRGIPHHLIDILDPWEGASVADYRKRAEEISREIEARGKQALFVGGTALYLKVLLRGMFDGPGTDPTLRASLESENNEALHARLARCDPVTAARLPVGDRRRVIRALEVFTLGGQPLSALHEHNQPAVGTRVFALERPREELYERINRRAAEMFQEGLLDEVRRIQSGPMPIHTVPAQGVGYREAIDHLEGTLGLDEAIMLVQLRTRHFAKRQGTWFRGLVECQAVPVGNGESAENVAVRLADKIRSAN